jgi:hypothetical protein
VPFFIPATLTENATECDSAPEAPVTLTVAVIGAAELAAVSVIVLPPAVPTGLKDAVTPGGSPLAVMLTPAANPFLGNTLIAAEALCPAVNDKLGVEVERRKSASPYAAGGSSS